MFGVSWPFGSRRNESDDEDSQENTTPEITTTQNTEEKTLEKVLELSKQTQRVEEEERDQIERAKRLSLDESQKNQRSEVNGKDREENTGVQNSNPFENVELKQEILTENYPEQYKNAENSSSNRAQNEIQNAVMRKNEKNLKNSTASAATHRAPSKPQNETISADPTRRADKQQNIAPSAATGTTPKKHQKMTLSESSIKKAHRKIDDIVNAATSESAKKKLNELAAKVIPNKFQKEMSNETAGTSETSTRMQTPEEEDEEIIFVKHEKPKHKARIEIKKEKETEENTQGKGEGESTSSSLINVRSLYGPSNIPGPTETVESILPVRPDPTKETGATGRLESGSTAVSQTAEHSLATPGEKKQSPSKSTHLLFQTSTPMSLSQIVAPPVTSAQTTAPENSFLSFGELANENGLSFENLAKESQGLPSKPSPIRPGIMGNRLSNSEHSTPEKSGDLEMRNTNAEQTAEIPEGSQPLFSTQSEPNSQTSENPGNNLPSGITDPYQTQATQNETVIIPKQEPTESQQTVVTPVVKQESEQTPKKRVIEEVVISDDEDEPIRNQPSPQPGCSYTPEGASSPLKRKTTYSDEDEDNNAKRQKKQVICKYKLCDEIQTEDVYDLLNEVKMETQVPDSDEQLVQMAMTKMAELPFSLRKAAILTIMAKTFKIKIESGQGEKHQMKCDLFFNHENERFFKSSLENNEPIEETIECDEVSPEEIHSIHQRFQNRMRLDDLHLVERAMSEIKKIPAERRGNMTFSILGHQVTFIFRAGEEQDVNMALFYGENNTMVLDGDMPGFQESILGSAMDNTWDTVKGFFSKKSSGH